MKKLFIKFISTSIFLLSLNANAALIYLEEAETIDNVITIDLKGSGFNQGLATGSFFVSWDSRMLTYTGISFNESLYDFYNDVRFIDLASGFLDDGIFSASPGVASIITSGEFLIATLSFDILAEGKSWVGVAEGWDSDGPQPYYAATGAKITDMEFAGTYVETSISVPEPGSLLLCFLGLFVLATCKQRGRTKLSP